MATSKKREKETEGEEIRKQEKQKQQEARINNQEARSEMREARSKQQDARIVVVSLALPRLEPDGLELA